MSYRVVSVLLLLVNLPLIIYFVPLATGRVARNKTYGYRTATSLASDEAWYRANRIAGRAGILVCVANDALDALNIAGVVAIDTIPRVMLLAASYFVLFGYVELRMTLFG